MIGVERWDIMDQLFRLLVMLFDVRWAGSRGARRWTRTGLRFFSSSLESMRTAMPIRSEYYLLLWFTLIDKNCLFR